MNNYSGKGLLARLGLFLSPRDFQLVQRSRGVGNVTTLGEVLVFLLDRSESMDEPCGPGSSL